MEESVRKDIGEQLDNIDAGVRGMYDSFKELHGITVYVWEVTRHLMQYAQHDTMCKWWENGDCDCGFEEVKSQYDTATELMQ